MAANVVMPSEKKTRRYVRLAMPTGIPVAWEHLGVRTISRLNVLALGGVFIATPDPPPAGTMIRLIFDVPGGEVRARALVRDSQPGKGMGVEFTAMSQQARAHLNRLMNSLIGPELRAGNSTTPRS